MSIRLNVVVVQSPRMTSLQVGIVAEIVIQLLGRPGIDLAMVESLEPEVNQSTDGLMLTGLESDLAIIDWRSAEQSADSLSRLGVNVSRTAHPLDLEAGSAGPGSRKLYAIDLRNGYKASEVVDSVLKLLAARQVVTVSLGIPRSKSTELQMPASAPAVAKPLKVTPISISPSPLKPSSTESKSSSVGSDSPKTSSSNRTSAEISRADDDDAALNALVDSLNDSDF